MGDLRHHALVELLNKAADAHHDATGGPDPEWVSWYARFLVDEIDDLLGYPVGQEKIEDWLLAAERRRQAESIGDEWAPTYARSILDAVAAEGG